MIFWIPNIFITLLVLSLSLRQLQTSNSDDHTKTEWSIYLLQKQLKNLNVVEFVAFWRNRRRTCDAINYNNMIRTNHNAFSSYEWDQCLILSIFTCRLWVVVSIKKTDLISFLFLSDAKSQNYESSTFVEDTDKGSRIGKPVSISENSKRGNVEEWKSYKEVRNRDGGSAPESSQDLRLQYDETSNLYLM